MVKQEQSARLRQVLGESQMYDSRLSLPIDTDHLEFNSGHTHSLINQRHEPEDAKFYTVGEYLYMRVSIASLIDHGKTSDEKLLPILTHLRYQLSQHTIFQQEANATESWEYFRDTGDQVYADQAEDALRNAQRLYIQSYAAIKLTRSMRGRRQVGGDIADVLAQIYELAAGNLEVIPAHEEEFLDQFLQWQTPHYKRRMHALGTYTDHH